MLGPSAPSSRRRPSSSAAAGRTKGSNCSGGPTTVAAMGSGGLAAGRHMVVAGRSSSRANVGASNSGSLPAAHQEIGSDAGLASMHDSFDCVSGSSLL